MLISKCQYSFLTYVTLHCEPLLRFDYDVIVADQSIEEREIQLLKEIKLNCIPSQACCLSV